MIVLSTNYPAGSLPGIELVSIQKQANGAETKVFEKFYRRHMADIPRIKFFGERRYQADGSFMDGHASGILF
jgi:hypothetical protein